MDLGVYVSTLNEELLIRATLKDVVKVFPQVEVIDLGSTDKTLEIVRSMGVSINEHVLDSGNAAKQWIDLKNDYGHKHDWTLLLDGDEIFDEENLLKLKDKAECGNYLAFHIGWKMARIVSGQKQISNVHPAGCKLYKGARYYFRKEWPNEVQDRVRRGPNRARVSQMEPKSKTDVWCWHGVLLQRSETIPEDTARKKKRGDKHALYNEYLQWEDVDKWPWT